MRRVQARECVRRVARPVEEAVQPVECRAIHAVQNDLLRLKADVTHGDALLRRANRTGAVST